MNDATPNSESRPITSFGRPFRRVPWLAAILVPVIAAAIIGWRWYRYDQDLLARMPVVAIEGLGPGVRGAIAEARRMVLRKPRSGPAWGRFGMVLLAHNFEEAAIACFSVAHELDLRNVRWLYYSGVARAISDPPQAILQFQTAAELAPQDPWPKFRLAELLLDGQRLDEAEQILLSLPESDQQTRLIYDRVRLALLRHDEAALKHIDASQLQQLQTDVNRRACLELLAQVWRRRGRPAEAESILRKLRAETTASDGWPDPYVSEVFALRKDPAWLASLAREELAAGQAEQAIQRLTELVADHPADPQWPIELARMWTQLKQPGNSKQVLRDAATRHPNSAEVQFELGNLGFQAQDWSSAAASYKLATRLKPDYGSAYYNLAQAQTKLRDEPAAIKSLRDALRCQPDFVPALLNLADLLQRTGQPPGQAEATQLLQRVIKLDPENKRAAELLDGKSR